MANVFRFCWPLRFEDYSLGLTQGFAARVPCSSANGAAVKCNQCFVASRARILWREKPIVYTELNILSPIWRVLGLWVSSPIPRVKTTKHAQYCGQSVQHAASNLASGWSSPNQSVAPDTLPKQSNEDHQPILSSYFLISIYIYTRMIKGQKLSRMDNPGCLGHFIRRKASLNTHHRPASARSDPGPVPSFGTLTPCLRYLSPEDLLPLWTPFRSKTFFPL